MTTETLNPLDEVRAIAEGRAMPDTDARRAARVRLEAMRRPERATRPLAHPIDFAKANELLRMESMRQEQTSTNKRLRLIKP